MNNNNQILEWRDEMSVGNETLDLQHQQLLKEIGILKFALITGEASDKLREVGKFLEEYIEGHLISEEKYMLENNFPGYKEHKKIHDKARQRFSVLLAKFFNENFDKEKIVEEVVIDLEEWWINHILGADQEYAEYINKKKKLENE